RDLGERVVECAAPSASGLERLGGILALTEERLACPRLRVTSGGGQIVRVRDDRRMVGSFLHVRSTGPGAATVSRATRSQSPLGERRPRSVSETAANGYAAGIAQRIQNVAPIRLEAAPLLAGSRWAAEVWGEGDERRLIVAAEFPARLV